MRTSGWWARLKARLRLVVVLPQPLVGEVIAERGPAVLPQRAQDLGAHHVEGGMRRVGVGEGDDAVAAPSAAGRARRPRARPRRAPARALRPRAPAAAAGDRPRPAARAAPAPAVVRCSLAFWMAAWMRSIGSLFLRQPPQEAGTSRAEPDLGEKLAEDEVERQVVGVDAKSAAGIATATRTSASDDQAALAPHLAGGADVGDGGEGLEAELRAQLDRPADRAVEHLEQHDEARGRRRCRRRMPAAGDQQPLRARPGCPAASAARSARSARPWRAPRCARRPGPGRGSPPRRCTGS